MRSARAITIAALAAMAVPAIAIATSYPGVPFQQACDYTSSNRESTYNIDMVVIHTAQGSYSGTISWFKNCASNASAHYVVSKTGAITAMVRDEDVAWHAGHWTTNTRSIGIEHEGYVTDPNAYTDAMYSASARLTRWLADRYAIPIDRSHVIGHNEVPGCSSGSGGGASCHTDPGPYWDWSRYMSLVRNNGADGSPPSVPSVWEDHTGSSWSTHSHPNWRFVATDAESGISLYEIDFTWGGTTTTTGTSYHPSLDTGEHGLRARAKNGAGLWSGWSGTVTARVDVTPPNRPSAAESHAGAAWTTHNHPYLAWSDPGDAGSGVGSYAARVDGADVWTGTGGAWHGAIGDGTRSLSIVAIDRVGLRSSPSAAITVRIDTTPPVTSISSPASYRSGTTTFVGPSSPFSLAATDTASGPAWTRYALDGGASTLYAGPFSVGHLAEGPHDLTAWSADVAGNVESPRSLPFVLDKTPPEVNVQYPGDGAIILTTDPVEVRADPVDALSGVAYVAFGVDGTVRAIDRDAPYSYLWAAMDEAAGPHYVTITAVDRVANAASVRSDVETAPMTQAGALATVARVRGWVESPPPAGLVAEGTSAGVAIGDQWVGVRLANVLG